MGISYPPNLVHILILLGFAKTFKFLAVPEVLKLEDKFWKRLYLFLQVIFPTHIIISIRIFVFELNLIMYTVLIKTNILILI